MMQAAPIPQAPPDSFTEVVKQPLLDHEKTEVKVAQCKWADQPDGKWYPPLMDISDTRERHKCLPVIKFVESPFFNRNTIKDHFTAGLLRRPPSSTALYPAAPKAPTTAIRYFRDCSGRYPKTGNLTKRNQAPGSCPLTSKEAPAPQILAELTPVDRLLITKRLRVKSVLFLRGKKNRYLVRTPDQNLVYSVEEENSWWVGYFCYGLRPLQLRVTNSQGNEVMRINRPYACTARVLPCQLQHLEVFAPPGTRIGSIEQQWAPVRPIYLVRGENGEEVFWIRGPRFTVSCFRDVQFHIMRTDGRQVGSTCKRWQGLVHAMFFAPVTDRFGVAFDRDLSAEEKALLLAATLLLDYMYYDV